MNYLLKQSILTTFLFVSKNSMVFLTIYFLVWCMKVSRESSKAYMKLV